MRVFPQRAVAVGRRSGGADGSELIAETGPWPWPVWGQRRGIAAGEPRGCGRPPWVGSAQCVKLLAAKLAHTGELLFARRAVESHGLGVIR